MSMIDIGVKIELAATAQSPNSAFAKPTSWTVLRECTSIPALLQPPSRISTDYVGDGTIGELLGKKAATGLDFQFGYDGSSDGTTYGTLLENDIAGTMHYMRITLPDGLKMIMLVKLKVTINSITPSAELTYTLSVIALDPEKQNITGVPDALQDNLVTIVVAGDPDPFA